MRRPPAACTVRRCEPVAPRSPYRLQKAVETHERFLRSYLDALSSNSLPNLWAITQTLAGPVASGKWTGMQNGIGNLAGVVAPTITGIVVDRTGEFFLAFVTAGVVSVLGALCFWFVVGPVKPIRWRTGSALLSE